MTKLFFTLVAWTFFGFLQAQSFKFSAGYAFPWSSQQIGNNTFTTYGTTTDSKTGAQIPHGTSSTESVRGSYGSGWVVSGSYNYKLSQNIGLELGITYIMGRKYNTLSTYSDTRSEVVHSFSRESEDSQGRAVLFTPTLRFTPLERIFSPYFLIGPVLGKIKFHRELERSWDDNGTQNTEYRYTKFTGGISLGIRGALGVLVMLNKKVSLFSEIIFTGMNYYPKESEITRYIVNGKDELSSLTGNVRKIIYERRVTTDSDNASDLVDRPGKSPRFSIAMSSLTASTGILISLR